MSEITSADLAAALNGQVIQETFDTVLTSRPSFLSAIGFEMPARPESGSKYTWMDQVIGASASATTAAALIGDTALTVADGTIFRKGMTLSSPLSDEVIMVVNIVGNVLTIVRGFGGSTATAIASGTVMTIDSVGREENSLAVTDGIEEPSLVENLFQTMDTAIDFSRRSLSTVQLGNQNSMARAIDQRVRQLAIQMDRMLIGGRKGTQAIDGKARTYSGGLRYFTDQTDAIKADNAAGALTLDAINAVNASIVTAGGSSDTIVVGINQARKLHALMSANYNSQRISDFQTDQNSVFTLPTDLPLIGSVNRIVVDTNVKNDELFIVDSGSVKIVPMDQGNGEDDGNWRTLDATAKGQDGVSLRVIGDFTVEMRNYKSNIARMHNIG